jgi:hypothetical protein
VNDGVVPPLVTETEVGTIDTDTNVTTGALTVKVVVALADWLAVSLANTLTSKAPMAVGTQVSDGVLTVAQPGGRPL